MVDISTIGVVSTSIGTLMDIAKAMKGVHDATLLDNKVFELQRAMLETQQSVFAANEERTELIERIRELEKEISGLKQWEAEKEKYKLEIVDATGVYAYARKPNPTDVEPHLFICANCYQAGRKSLLQATSHTAMGKRVHVCPNCKAEIAFGAVPIPSDRPSHAARYNPLADR